MKTLALKPTAEVVVRSMETCNTTVIVRTLGRLACRQALLILLAAVMH